MPTTAQTPNREGDRDQISRWIALASMFVGQRLDKWVGRRIRRGHCNPRWIRDHPSRHPPLIRVGNLRTRYGPAAHADYGPRRQRGSRPTASGAVSHTIKHVLTVIRRLA